MLIIEGGFRAWEAQKLPVEAGKSSLPASVLNNLALKIGAELVATVEQVSPNELVEAKLASPQKCLEKRMDKVDEIKGHILES